MIPPDQIEKAKTALENDIKQTELALHKKYKFNYYDKNRLDNLQTALNVIEEWENIQRDYQTKFIGYEVKDEKIRVLEAELKKLREALEQIYQELGRPRMAYNSKIERAELMNIVEKVSDIAKSALDRK